MIHAMRSIVIQHSYITLLSSNTISALTVLDGRISKEVLAMYTMIEQSHIRRYPPRLILIEYSPICQLIVFDSRYDQLTQTSHI